MEGKHPQAQNYLLACYGVSLVKGETIRGTMIRKTTLVRYINAALKLFAIRGIPNPRETADVDLVKIIIDAVGQYEQVPKRRLMISDAMMLEIIDMAEKSHPDSLTAAIADWIILGRYTGFRLGEFGQESDSEYATIGYTDEAVAMISDDFVFFGPGQRRLDQHELPPLDEIEGVKLEWRDQKNGDNGQKIPYTKNKKCPRICGVAAAYRIRRRADRLKSPHHYPLGVHRTGTTSSNAFITGEDIGDLLQTVAAKVYNLNASKRKDREILKRYSAHSIRVTAANILHRMGKSDSYIQTRLRWKSTTFLMYLRNTIYAADEHSALMDIPDCHIPVLTTRDGRPMRQNRPVEPIDSFQALANAAPAA